VTSAPGEFPIVAVTAFAMEWHEREVLDGGCDAYISKPIAILGFLHRLEPFLSRVPQCTLTEVEGDE
jgi:two-component system cell cycle response regulator DivK